MSEFVRIRNVHTGAIASLPESVLQNLPDWVVDPGPPPDVAKPKKNLRRAEASGDTEDLDEDLSDEDTDAEASGDTEDLDEDLSDEDTDAEASGEPATSDAVTAASSKKE